MDMLEKEFDMIIPLSVGDKVPAFPVKAFHKNGIQDTNLDEYHGKWYVLFFYPADFTFVCPTELGEMANLYPEFQKANVEVLSVSTDSAFSHKAWCDRSDTIKKIQFPMLADTTLEISRMFGVLSDEGMSRRGTFIVNPEGIIMAVEIVDDNIGRSAEETLHKTRALAHTHKNKGEVTPAGWKKEGDEVLKPGIDLIGNI